MGLPTYCDVVTITEKVRRIRLDMHQCRRNTVYANEGGVGGGREVKKWC
jgi:hypothetical protein